MTPRIKSLLFIFAVLSLFPLTCLYRQHVSDDIRANSKYTIGKIIKFTTSLKSGDYWYYEFKYKDSVFSRSQSTHVDYDAKLGDYFLIHFSSKDPDHSKMLYDYKLKETNVDYTDSVWDTIPKNILHSGLKTN